MSLLALRPPSLQRCVGHGLRLVAAKSLMHTGRVTGATGAAGDASERALKIYKRVKMHNVWYVFSRQLSEEAGDFAEPQEDPIEDGDVAAGLDMVTEEEKLLNMTVPQIAEALRGRMLVGGRFEYIEESPPLARAQRLKNELVSAATTVVNELVAESERPDQLSGVSSQRRSLSFFNFFGSDEPYQFSDNRQYFPDNTSPPNNYQMVLGAQNSWEAQTYDYVDTVYCSGTLIGHSTVISAAHCFYSAKTKQWILAPASALGHDSSDYQWTRAPYGTNPCYSVILSNSFAWSNELDTTWKYYDFALMMLDYYACPEEWTNGVSSKKPGASIGTMGFWSNMHQSTFSSYTKYNRGYPGQYQQCGTYQETCGVRLWGDSTTSGTASGSTISFDNGIIYTSPGMSGSAVFVYYGSSQYVIGINSYKNTFNSAFFRRVTTIVSDFIFAHSPDYSIDKSDSLGNGGSAFVVEDGGPPSEDDIADDPFTEQGHDSNSNSTEGVDSSLIDPIEDAGDPEGSRVRGSSVAIVVGAGVGVVAVATLSAYGIRRRRRLRRVDEPVIEGQAATTSGTVDEVAPPSSRAPISEIKV
eukprot:scaffold604_cov384-Prasinococcus_capsulatus_cf.AAC.29